MKIFQTNDKNLRELIKGSSSAFFLKIAGMLFTYLSMLFITRFYGAEAWGIYTLGFTVLSIAVVIPVFGFDNSIIRLLTDLKQNNSESSIFKVLFKATSITIILSIVVILGINYYSDFITNSILKQKGFEPYLLFVRIAVLPMALLILISVVFQSYKRILQFMLFKSALLSFTFLILLCVFYFLEIDAKIFEIYVYAILVTLSIATIAFIFFSKSFKHNHVKQPNRTYSFKDIIYLSFPMMLSSSFALLMGWTDILMLSYYKAPKDIGIYNSALKLASITLIALASVNSISSPKFAEFYSKKDFKGLKDVVQKSTKIMFITSAPILLIFIVFPKTILGIFGSEFVSGYIVLILLCIARFVNSVSGSVGHLMQMTNNQKTYQYVIIIAFIINLILNFLLIPKFGINGAALSSSIAMIFWNVTLVIIIKKKLGFWTCYIPFIVK
ncbi:flippase [Psychroserpens sp.]|uniref:flippase n=1 Tax=Psychroserpens sp. TaxID=2020870 RepID=UPI002B27730B|nr:flippase [Psychroserpens sp.]